MGRLTEKVAIITGASGGIGAAAATPDLARYTVPGVERFYLVGPFMHPGAGLTGAGRATAMRILQDLEIDFGKVIA
jgi:hypothetical protein